MGSRTELRNSKETQDQFGMKAFGTVKIETRKKKRNKGKSVQVKDLEDMYVKNQFGISMLNMSQTAHY